MRRKISIRAFMGQAAVSRRAGPCAALACAGVVGLGLPQAAAFQSLAPSGSIDPVSIRCDRSTGAWIDTGRGGARSPSFFGREAAVVRVALRLSPDGVAQEVVFAYPDVVSWFDDAVRQSFLGRRYAPDPACRPPAGAVGEVKDMWTYFMPTSPAPGYERLQAVVDFWVDDDGRIGAVEINTARGDFDAKSLARAPLRQLAGDLVRREAINRPGVYRARMGVAGWMEMTGDWTTDRSRLRPIVELEGLIVDLSQPGEVLAHDD
jgi:hypothetical protein